jgi:hypothetical protein
VPTRLIKRGTSEWLFPPILVGRAERRDVRFREGEQRSRASDMAPSSRDLGWPKADRLLWAIETLKRTSAPTQSRGSSRPTSVIGRLRSHSRKQTFAVLPHRQDCALVGRFTEVRLCSKADVRSAAVIEWAKSGHPMPNSKCLRPLTAFQPSASDAFRTSPPLCPSRFSYSSLRLRSRLAVHAIPKLVVPNRGSARPKRKSSLRYRRSSRSVSPCQNSTSSAPSFLSLCGRQSTCLCFVSAKAYSERVPS